MIELSDLSQAVRDIQYAVRGPVYARALELEAAGRPIIYCNIGNPQAFAQKPLTYLRQVLSLVQYPDLLRAPAIADLYPADVLAKAAKVLQGTQHGVGAYSDSKGVPMIRAAVAAFIRERDGIDAHADAIYLTDGASKGVQAALRMLVGGNNDGIMIPIPQYPLYSATITLYNGRRVDYLLDEEHDWKLLPARLEASLRAAEDNGVRVRAICVINPSNPTGAVLDAGDIARIVDFARAHRLSILADEVYQENVYRPGEAFVSFAKVMAEKGVDDVSLFSFHSCSKGLVGECGQRGGYMEIRNVPPAVVAEITKLQSVGLCANLTGQIATWCMVTPPKPGEPSHALYAEERGAIFGELARRARILADGLNRIPGIHCNPVAGAMYAFPRITLPEGRNDQDYCLALLEATGICVVPGSGFGQQAGTAHFRTTILPPTEQIAQMVEKLREFHAAYR